MNSTADISLQIAFFLLVLSAGIVATVFLLKWISSKSTHGNPLIKTLMLAKKITATQPQRMRNVASLSLGPRQKLLLLEIDGERVLLGVTPNNITSLLMSQSKTEEKAPPLHDDNFPAHLKSWLAATKQEAA